MDSTRFHRSDLATIKEYVTPPQRDLSKVIKLDSNENPYGPSPKAVQALANFNSWQFYPSQEELRLELARFVGTKPENVVVSNGADESIDLVLRATLEPGEVVIDCPPSFEMYRVYTQAHRGRLVQVERRDDFSLDLDGVAATCDSDTVKIIIVGSPNNPDGMCLSSPDLERLLSLGVLVVIDEAYTEFSGESNVPLVAAHENLVNLRTFSKWAGLAGLRIGYSVMSANLAAAVNKLRSPYNVNAAGIVAARASLDDQEYLMTNVRAIVAERERMFRELGQIDYLGPVPGRGNFVLCRVLNIDAQMVKNNLLERNILVRTYQDSRLKEYIRITIGTPQQNVQVLAALNELRGARK